MKYQHPLTDEDRTPTKAVHIQTGCTCPPCVRAHRIWKPGRVLAAKQFNLKIILETFTQPLADKIIKTIQRHFEEAV